MSQHQQQQAAAGGVEQPGLNKQFGRSVTLEQVLLIWLAIERNLVPLEGLLTDRLVRVVDRTLLLSIQAHTGSVMAVAVSADGRLRASGGTMV